MRADLRRCSAAQGHGEFVFPLLARAAHAAPRCTHYRARPIGDGVAGHRLLRLGDRQAALAGLLEIHCRRRRRMRTPNHVQLTTGDVAAFA